MPLLPKSVLKTYFQKGDQPSEAQFYSLIDSSLNLLDDQKYLGLKNYNTTIGYAPGDVTVYNGAFYQALTSTSGVFDPAAWQAIGSGGGGGGIISMTYAALNTLKTAGNLAPGQIYYITDKSIWLHALTVSELSLSGYFMALNADYQNTGGFNVGVWNMGLSGLVPGQSICIWNNLHWVCVNGVVSGPPDTNPSEWTLSTPPADTTYVMEIDPVKYDFDLDFMFERSDKRGNFVSSMQDAFGSLGMIPLEVFQWGRDGVNGNVVKNSVLNIMNCVTPNSAIEITDLSQVTLLENANGSNAIFSGTGVFAGGTTDLTKTVIRNMVLRTSGAIINPGRRVEPGFSNFTATVELGGSVLNLIGYNYAGVFQLTSPNPTESINFCDVPPTEHPFELRPADGLAVEIVNGTAHRGEFMLDVPSFILEGTRGDFAKFQVDSLGRVRLLQVVNYI